MICRCIGDFRIDIGTCILNGTMNSGACVYALEYQLLLTFANRFGDDHFIFCQHDVNCDQRIPNI